MPTATVNGVTLSYTDAGQGPAVVLIHGFPLDARMWQRQVESLSRRFRVLAPDLRGFGKSPSIEPFTMESLADDVRGLMAEVDALPAVVCGLSMGGYVTLAMARKYPADLRAMVLIDTRAEGDSAEGKSGREKAIDLVRQGGTKAIAEQMLPKMLSEHSRQNQPQVVDEVRRMMESCPPRTIEHALAALRDRDDCSTMLPSIAVPTLIIVGENDTLTPPDLSRAMHKSIPRSQLAIIPRAGHLSPVEQPDAVTREIERFIGEQFQSG
jgi:3-oxoadipate enol-lactonase